MIIHVYQEYWNQGMTVAAFPTPHLVNRVVEMQDWCRTVYGEPGRRWKDHIQYGEVLFDNPQDVELFLLRWA